MIVNNCVCNLYLYDIIIMILSLCEFDNVDICIFDFLYIVWICGIDSYILYILKLFIKVILIRFDI